ncbi:hypothetical protein BTA51_11520 [Hahella sp. CCB-MM4]|uniref:DCC1-like thiol-disulfide oxidoreductase family protein n=1 Tax=Hahella sp. (strain CCB-MM4) TaxID=1926491 RepID=UPI000B9BF847|nr:DCC1-like thiol-disulfide oxidoreductase family protein [Hahella sp. CCB-MM4]OZG73119.1 hypothetical protein BTA51_11520 [Hahella sp. CCB-MM4]
MDKITVYYDASCAGCRRDRRRYDRWAGEGKVNWCDITGQETLLRGKGIDPLEAQLKLHIELPDGHVEKDIESYIVLLNQIIWLKPLAWLISLPWIREPLRVRYRRSVTRRLQEDGRLVCQNCDNTGTSSDS